MAAVSLASRTRAIISPGTSSPRAPTESARRRPAGRWPRTSSRTGCAGAFAWGRSPYPIIVASVAVQEAGAALRLVLVSLCLALVPGCGSSPSPEVGEGPDGTPDPVLVAGRAVYADRCSSCHDADGSGTGDGPRLNRGHLLSAYPAAGGAAAVVSGGRGRMPGFGGILTAGEISAVLRYINEVL